MYSLEKDFGEILHEIRIDHNLTESELVARINIPTITEKNIRKWERDLEYPDLTAIYKLSEIYQIASAEFLAYKEATLRRGVEGINKQVIRWISFILNVSIYSAIWICRIFLAAALIFGFLLLHFSSIRFQAAWRG